MQGVTTAIVGFIFACLIWPGMVKNKPQYYSALGMVLVVILFDAIGQMSQGTLNHIIYILAAILQMLAMVVLVMCVGGLTPRQFAREVAQTIEAIRHGEDKGPVIVPRTGEVPKKPEPEPSARISLHEDGTDDLDHDQAGRP